MNSNTETRRFITECRGARTRADTRQPVGRVRLMPRRTRPRRRCAGCHRVRRMVMPRCGSCLTLIAAAESSVAEGRRRHRSAEALPLRIGTQ